ncbi:biotin-dependent carboxyltransferase family protein [Reinekea blandensis]|uniref:Carboxyltransferase domain-containing protein n=1 Tax=Reinekea blandensis MED297 TaxID=314283 RepID=A4B8Y5_9GAMM|nr:biotin-dependent carboxyltransferase family protein [Reinekea blandensis]EAR11086.1 hypothetical protein MED297_19402 [Reinekea sp. MED297] [Reinekea blandensis MED297]
MTFSVVKAGPQTTIQDAGRAGYSHLGMTEGGPMDVRSFVIANKLVGNPDHLAGLEVTLGGLELICNAPTTLAVTGAYCPLLINGKPRPLWCSHRVETGDRIELGFAALGVRAYVAFTGGLMSESWYHSQSVVVREGLGRALQNGDDLTVQETHPAPLRQLKFHQQPSLRKWATLTFVPGFQWQHIPEHSQTQFLNSEFRVSARSDRMGCQLDGPGIDTGIERLYSEGICTGSIQVTGQGVPVVLMRDHQTIGGYPKLGALTTASQCTLAQLPQNSALRFKAISSQQGIEEFRAFNAGLAALSFA